MRERTTSPISSTQAPAVRDRNHQVAHQGGTMRKETVAGTGLQGPLPLRAATWKRYAPGGRLGYLRLALRSLEPAVVQPFQAVAKANVLLTEEAECGERYQKIAIAKRDYRIDFGIARALAKAQRRDHDGRRHARRGLVAGKIARKPFQGSDPDSAIGIREE